MDQPVVRLVGVVGCVVALVVAAACTSSKPGRDSGSTPQPGSSPPPARSAQLWSRTDLKPIGQPVQVAGVVVGYVTAGRALFLIGLDPASGKELWRQAASPGDVTPGIPLGVVVVGDRVAYFRPDPQGNLVARLVVADPRTGADRAVTRPALFTSSAQPCPNNKDVCTASRDNNQDRGRPHRLRVDT